MFQDNILILFNNRMFAHNKSREQPQVFCSKDSIFRLFSFFQEIFNKILYLCLVNCCSDSKRIITQNTQYTFLYVGFVNIVRMFKEKINPPRYIYPILLKIGSNFLQQPISILKNISNFKSNSSILRRLIIFFNKSERIVKIVQNFY